MSGPNNVNRPSAKAQSETTRAHRGPERDLTLFPLTHTRNKALLSFGAEPEEPVDPVLAKAKLKSAHDVLEDERLSKQVIDDRGTSVTLPPGMEGPVSRKRKVETAPAPAKKSEPTLTRVRDDSAKKAASEA